MRTKALDQFCAWLEQTPVSQTIQSVSWIVPAVQTVHILAIAAVMASVLMINLRIIRIVGRGQPLQSYSARFLPASGGLCRYCSPPGRSWRSASRSDRSKTGSFS